MKSKKCTQGNLRIAQAGANHECTQHRETCQSHNWGILSAQTWVRTLKYDTQWILHMRKSNIARLRGTHSRASHTMEETLHA